MLYDNGITIKTNPNHIAATNNFTLKMLLIIKFISQTKFQCNKIIFKTNINQITCNNKCFLKILSSNMTIKWILKDSYHLKCNTNISRLCQECLWFSSQCIQTWFSRWFFNNNSQITTRWGYSRRVQAKRLLIQQRRIWETKKVRLNATSLHRLKLLRWCREEHPAIIWD